MSRNRTLTVRCPECDSALSIEQSESGNIATCPKCNADFTVPDSPSGEDPPSRSTVNKRSRLPKKTRRGKQRTGLSNSAILGIITCSLLFAVGFLVAVVFGLKALNPGSSQKDIMSLEWKLFAPPGERFSVILPGTPTAVIPKTNDKPVNTLGYELIQSDFQFYIAVASYPGDVTESQIFDSIMKRLRDTSTVINANISPDSQNQIALNTEYQTGKVTDVSRSYFINQKLIVIGVKYSNAKNKTTEEVINIYLNSIHFR